MSQLGISTVKPGPNHEIKALRQLADKEKLFQEGVISQKELDDFRDLVKEKEKAVTNINLSLEQVPGMSGIDVQAERVSVLEYDLKRMKNKLNQKRERHRFRLFQSGGI